MITFETTDKTPERGPIFADVAEDQFFVDRDGELCQKYTDESYNILADAAGQLISGRVDHANPAGEIKKILCASFRELLQELADRPAEKYLKLP